LTFKNFGKMKKVMLGLSTGRDKAITAPVDTILLGTFHSILIKNSTYKFSFTGKIHTFFILNSPVPMGVNS
jgi:hypothetical protein